MNKTYIWGLVIVVIILGAWYFKTSSTPKVAMSGEPIKIGAVLGLTGPASVDALNMKRGIDMAKDDLLVKGINVEIAYEDDGTDAAKTVSATQKLIATIKPSVLIGFTWDFNLSAAAPVLATNKVVGYAPSNTNETFTTDNQYVFYGSVLNEKKVDVIAEYLKAHNIKKVGIMVSKTSWGDNHVDIFTRAANKAGAEVVLVEKLQYGAEATTVPTIVAKLKQNKAEAVLVTHSESATGILLNKMQESGLDVPVLGTVDIRNAVERGLVKKTAKSDWMAFVNPVDPDFKNRFFKKYNAQPGNYASNAYDGLMVLAEASMSTDGSSEAIAKYLKGGSIKYKGYTTTSFKFNDKGALSSGVWEFEAVK